MDKVKELAYEISKELAKVEIENELKISITVTVRAGVVEINTIPR